MATLRQLKLPRKLIILPTFLSLYCRARRIWVSALLNLNTLTFNMGKTLAQRDWLLSSERLVSTFIDAEVDWEQCVFRRSKELSSPGVPYLGSLPVSSCSTGETGRSMDLFPSPLPTQWAQHQNSYHTVTKPMPDSVRHGPFPSHSYNLFLYH